MKRFPTLLATMALLSPCLAQEGEEIDIEERKRSLPIVEAHIAEREARMTEIANDIIALDRRLEGKIDRIVTRLAGISDSPKSRYRISEVKKEAMEGLARTIEAYQSKRASVIREIREGRSGIPREVLEGDAKAFDEHIEKRVEQILELSKSFSQDEDVEKYEKVSGGTYFQSGIGWTEGVYGISDEYRQNRRDRVMNKKQREEVMAALKKSIERHRAQIRRLEEFGKSNALSEADRELVATELRRNKALASARESQLEDLTMVDKPATEAVSRDTALDIEEALNDAAEDMRRDFNTIFTKYAELNDERAKVFRLKRNLETRRQWIADYEAGKKE